MEIFNWKSQCLNVKVFQWLSLSQRTLHFNKIAAVPTSEGSGVRGVIVALTEESLIGKGTQCVACNSARRSFISSISQPCANMM